MTDCMKCYLHYKDGLTMTLELSPKDFDETWDIWKMEIDSDGEDELVYLNIRKFTKGEISK